MSKLTKEDVMTGNIDARSIKLVDITEYADEAGVDFVPDTDKTLRENLEDLRDALVEKESAPAETVEEVEPQEESSTIVEEAQEEDLPPYLARRAHLIKKAMEETKRVMSDAPTYGPDAPEYLKRRGK
jgi:hypothetical protein